jgi:molecular chaperone DnaK
MKVGIDLGTTFSLIARVGAQGLPALFPDRHDASQFQTPSVVHIEGDQALVGQPAEDLLEDQPATPVARFVKARLGEEQAAYLDSEGRGWRAEAVSALILRKLLQDAQAFEDEDVTEAVITVPARFADAARKATKAAASLAGIRRLRLVEEPVAAAVYYGQNSTAAEQLFLTYDLGGGTFDASILRVGPEGLKVLAVDGDNTVGGRHIDSLIADLVAAEFVRRHGFDPRQDPAAMQSLVRFSERTKIRLSSPGRGEVRQSLLLAGRAVEFLLSRVQFERLIGPQVDRSLEACQRCLAQAGIPWGRISRVLMVGGGAHLPLVQRKVAIASQRPASDILLKQPHQAVAFGAAVLAHSGQADEEASAGRALHPIAAWDLGLRVFDRATRAPGFQPLIRAGSALPASHTATFYTQRDDQARLILELVQFRAGSPPEEDSLGVFAFGPIARPRKNLPIEVTLSYDAEGLVRVVARQSDSGQTMNRVLDDQARVHDAELARQGEALRQLKLNL